MQEDFSANRINAGVTRAVTAPIQSVGHWVIALLGPSQHFGKQPFPFGVYCMATEGIWMTGNSPVCSNEMPTSL